jgi:hypothetical protein
MSVNLDGVGAEPFVFVSSTFRMLDHVGVGLVKMSQCLLVIPWPMDMRSSITPDWG